MTLAPTPLPNPSTVLTGGKDRWQDLALDALVYKLDILLKKLVSFKINIKYIEAVSCLLTTLKESEEE